MWKLKKCSRCGGDVFIDKDEYGWYEQCLQCGYTGALKNITELGEPDSKYVCLENKTIEVTKTKK